MSLPQVRQIRSPFTPSTITTFVTTDIFNRFVIAASVFRASTWSMQGTKIDWPTLNLLQSS
jgi:hypothetical protein